jgi:hypothetical protein
VEMCTGGQSNSTRGLFEPPVAVVLGWMNTGRLSLLETLWL